MRKNKLGHKQRKVRDKSGKMRWKVRSARSKQ